jgi:hypothetical protein
MYENTADGLRKIADYVEKHKLDYIETAILLREISDEQDAQSIVVKLRDDLKNKNI